MSDNLITYAFVAGEVSDTLFGRTDLEKYDLGLAECVNYFVDYRGGISTRAGTEFTDYIEDDDQPTRMFPFRFAPNVENTYVILFYAGGVRFIQDGGYVLEANQAITAITQASPAVVSVTGHGFSTGDWVKLSGVGGMTRLNGQTFQVGVTTANTFQLLNPLTGANYSTVGFPAYTSGGDAARIYTISHPYSVSDFVDLYATQIGNVIRLTHPDWQQRNLTRVGTTNWTITKESFGTEVDKPGTITITPSAAGSAEAIFAVTAVDANGQESEQSDPRLRTGMVDYSTTAGFARIVWSPVAGAVSYNVYRSRLVDGAITKSEQLGYIGSVFGPEFVDNNIIPDFTLAPPFFTDPFADRAILALDVTAGGSGYDRNDKITISGGGGSGFRGVLLVNTTGAVIGVQIINGGSEYVTPVATITNQSGGATGGTGATFDIQVGLSAGRFPHVSTVFQQRQIYAANGNSPLSIWGSKPGYLSDFSVSWVLTDGDAFEFTIDSEVVSPIRHVIPSRLGLLVLTQNGIWLLHGGSERAVTPLNAVADPQTSTGVAKLVPIKMDTDLLYLEDKGRTVRLLSYDELQKAFAGRDMSILANHLFKQSNQVTHWTFARSPHSLIWARREDGIFLSFTFEKEQNIFAWTRHKTKGLVEDILAIEEGTLDSLYLVVKRKVNGRWTKFIERMALREFDLVEDAWCVDCGLKTPSVTPAAQLTPAAASGTGVTFTADANVFAVGDVGSKIRVGCGRGTIASFVSATSVLVDIDIPITDVIPDTSTPLPAESGEWTMDAPFSTLSGLDHLEGETVKVLLDGVVLADKVVTNGAITLGTSGTKAIVGLGYRAIGKTLPPTAPNVSIESNRKNIVGSAVRVHDTRGLKVGADLDHLYEVRESADDILLTYTGFKYVLVAANWNEDGQTFYVQDNPLPATILGLVLDLEVGDDTN